MTSFFYFTFFLLVTFHSCFGRSSDDVVLVCDVTWGVSRATFQLFRCCSDILQLFFWWHYKFIYFLFDSDVLTFVVGIDTSTFWWWHCNYKKVTLQLFDSDTSTIWKWRCNYCCHNFTVHCRKLLNKHFKTAFFILQIITCF